MRFQKQQLELQSRLLYTLVLWQRPNAKLISTTLSDAIAFQLFNYRRDRNHTLVFVSMTFVWYVVFIVLLTDFVECYEILNSRSNTRTPTQIHVGSVATICAFATKSDAVPHDIKYSMSDLLKMDAIFLTLLIIVLLGKYASGSHSGRSRDMVTLGLLLGVEIIPCIVDPSISVHDNTMSKLLFLAVFIHTASALRLLTRTWCSSAKREFTRPHIFMFSREWQLHRSYDLYHSFMS